VALLAGIWDTTDAIAVPRVADCVVVVLARVGLVAVCMQTACRTFWCWVLGKNSMAKKAIVTDSVKHRTTGFARPAVVDTAPGTPAQTVHDGDTVNVQLDGNLGLRLLGIDTPEISFSLPSGQFAGLEDPRWTAFLSDPWSDQWGAMSTAVPDSLKAFLQAKTGPQAAMTHYEHAVASREEFRKLVEQDMQILQQDPTAFRYYMNFGFEVMDGYGRLLCMLNRNQPNATQPTPRPPTYNLRMLERGRAFPYFIWPNINPWDRPETIEEAVIPPGQAKQLAESDRELRTARAAVKDARRQHLGIFDMMRPLQLEPFELRNLSRRVGASRYLIDLTSASDELLHPLNYSSVPFSEDRLWIPGAYVPLFEKAGWKVPGSPI
jgi:endonuclease YncB( thermonuclease family)